MNGFLLHLSYIQSFAEMFWNDFSSLSKVKCMSEEFMVPGHVIVGQKSDSISTVDTDNKWLYYMEEERETMKHQTALFF